MNEKRLQWELIKSEVAEVLVMFNQVFGKPKAVRVELQSGLVVESGTFTVIRPGFDVCSLQGNRRYNGKS